MQLFYQENFSLQNAFELEESETKHCLQVLRHQQGDILQLTNGKGLLASAKIEKIQGKKCYLKVVESRLEEKKEAYSIHLAIAPTKNADRMEWLIEKCVEIGIDEVSFLQTQHSERKFFGLERLQKKALSALKQSLKVHLPKINPIQGFRDFVQKASEEQKFIAYVDQQNPQTLFGASQKNQNYCILIGPEGDFSKEELEMALDKNFQKVSLGNSRLRTETAALVAVMSLHLKNEL